ncbi:MAG: recombinase family protein [Thioalkalivibrio sp.]|nr:recombinase family protein [Thioalkalivibrio sp.]
MAPSSGHVLIVGCARVSTVEQNLDLQGKALQKAGCERMYEDRVSGAKADRSGWREARAALRAADTLEAQGEYVLWP